MWQTAAQCTGIRDVLSGDFCLQVIPAFCTLPSAHQVACHRVEGFLNLLKCKIIFTKP